MEWGVFLSSWSGLKKCTIDDTLVVKEGREVRKKEVMLLFSSRTTDTTHIVNVEIKVVT